MNEFAGRQSGRSSVDDLWRHTLSRISSVFGRLAYLASLRDAATGFYIHHGLAQRFGREEAHQAIQHSHESTVFEWLHLELAQQKSDLEQYLVDQKEEWQAVLSNWRRTGRYEIYLPQDLSPAEQDLYRTDMSLVVEAIAREKGEAELPADSPPQSPDR